MTTSNATMTSVTIKRGRRGLSIGIAATAAVGLFLGGLGATASAAPGDTSADTTEANVDVETSIELSGLTTSFTLTGIPGATTTAGGTVTMTVETNNLAGYNVTVAPAPLTPALVADTAGNTDVIPIGALSVKESIAPPAAFTALSNSGAPGFEVGVPVTVHTQPTRSAEDGDDLSNDYQVIIPFVNEDNYSATLDYVATTL